MTKTEALKATKQGAIAGFIVAAISCAITAYAIHKDASSGPLAYFNDSITYFDAFLVLALAYGVYLKSRFAAVLLFVYYIVARVIVSIETGGSIATLTTLIILFFLGRAVYGSFTYQQIVRREKPNSRMSKWWYALTIPAVSAIGLILIVAVGSTTGVIPSTKVLAGSDIRDSEVQLLRDNNIVTAQEEVTHFYSEGLFSILDGGNILTDTRVISYYRDEAEKFQIFEINLADITDVDLVLQGDLMNDSIYEIHSIDGAWLTLLLSTEQEGDMTFINTLQSRMAGVAGKSQFTDDETVSSLE